MNVREMKAPAFFKYIGKSMLSSTYAKKCRSKDGEHPTQPGQVVLVKDKENQFLAVQCSACRAWRLQI